MNILNLQTLIMPVIVLTLSCDPSACGKSQQVGVGANKSNGPTISRTEDARVQEAADRFIKRFRQTLDFGTVFDEMFVQDAIRRLRTGQFFSSINLTPQLIESLDDQELERVYKAFMNSYYLRAVYDLGVGKNNTPPPDVEAVVKASKFANLLSNEGSGDAMIATRQEFEDFVREMTNIAGLYKAHLTPKVFASAAYKTRVRALYKSGGQVAITDGLEDFGVAKGTKVYQLDKDLFQFFFIEENGQFKVLNLGMGN